MKLWIKKQDGESKAINVSFWSFAKCSILTQLALTGIIYGTLALIGFVVIFLESF